MENFEIQAISVNELVEDAKLRFETLQQACDLVSDLINNFEWSPAEKNHLVYCWTQLIKGYWDLCQKLGINPLPKV